MNFTRQLAAAIPLAELATANTVFQKLRDTTGTDWGPGNLSVKLSTKPNNVHTHWGMSVPVTEADWAVIVGMLDRGERPKGVSADEVLAFKKLIYRVEPYGHRHPRELWAEFLAANSLGVAVATI